VIEKQLDRVDRQPTWTISGARYVGQQACAQCHPDQATTQGASAMAHALSSPSDSLVLKSHPRLTFSNGPYRYTVERQESGIIYAVTDGTNTISLPVAWAFGLGVGEVGQTYLLSYNGSYYEGRVTFYDRIQGLDITLGHSPRAPTSLQDALGRTVKPEELRACFGCHSTAAVSDGRLELDKLTPGITCEGCHGPGAEHVAAVQSGMLRPPHIFNPATLTAGDLVKFCGACHRTRAHVEALHLKGTVTARFQPYRLTESRCFSAGDRRISCLACHDPHQNPEHEPAFYDSKCLACHDRGSAPRSVGVSPVEAHGQEPALSVTWAFGPPLEMKLLPCHSERSEESASSIVLRKSRFLVASLLGMTGRGDFRASEAKDGHATGRKAEPTSQRRPPTCPVASSRCVTCHMPKYEPVGSHFKFTDHRIRVVRLGDSFD
jgi:hypothetical protein